MKLFVKIFLCLFFAHSRMCVFTQDSTKHCFVNGIGVKSGITLSRLVMKNSPTEAANGKTDYISSPYFALTSEFFHHKNFRLATDIGFIQKGGKIDGSSEVKTKLNFFFMECYIHGNAKY